MQVPIEIVFQNCQPSDALRGEIEKHVARLEKFANRIISCRVVVRAPATRHRHGEAFRIELRLVLPQRKDIIVNQPRRDEPEGEYPLVAVA